MVYVEIGERDNLDRKLREFRREVIRSGIFEEVRKRVCFRSPREMKKYKQEVENRKRARRKQRRLEKQAQERQES